jgi:predicted alpha/beta-hydrolase family hydrolase
MTESQVNATWRVEVGADAVTAMCEAAEDARGVFVFAHGAGGRMDDAGMLRLSAAFRARGLSTVRFNFVYREKGSGRPDPMPRLMECVSAVVARVRDELRPPLLVIGGRSMGGRAASMLAAEGFACDGLLLLAYPLHPDKQPEKLRDAHLPSVQAPVLCFNGTRDALCRRDLMETTLTRVGPNWTMHWLEGADHSFHVLKSSGRTDEQVVDEVADTTRGWLAGLG